MKSLLTPKTQTGCFPLHNLFNLHKLYKSIQKNEGYRNKPYKDLLGNKTIGCGHLIKKTEKFLLKNSQSKKYLAQLFVKDVNTAIKNFIKHYNANKLPNNVQEVIIEMIFQLGIKNTLGFSKFNRYIKKKQFFMAALEMTNSLWYKQTPRRVNRLVATMLYENNE